MPDARLEAIVRNCRNTTPSSCGGYLEPTATGQPGAYVSTILLSTGAVNLEQFPGFPFEEDLDQGMAQIVSYDRAECNDSYIGQVNMLQATSFSGVNGAIWGYDLAVGSRIGKTYPVGRIENIPKNHVGCALAGAPYVTLPEGAFSNISPESEILELSTEDWLSRVGLSEVDEPRYELKTLTGPHIA